MYRKLLLIVGVMHLHIVKNANRFGEKGPKNASFYCVNPKYAPKYFHFKLLISFKIFILKSLIHYS